jgi:tetratricopeptide (TPR) repeat protein
MLFALLLLSFAACGFAQDPAPDLKTLIEAGNSVYLKGDYAAARESLLKAWELAQQMPPAAPERYDVLKRLTSVRTAEGEFADANNWLQMAINWRENTLGKEDPKVAEDLLISVGLARGLKEYERAMNILLRVRGIHLMAYGSDSIPIADDFSRMAQVYMEQKNVDGAIGYLNNALTIRAKLAGPLDPTLVPELDRLAGAYVAKRSYPDAEAAYRRALVIRETLLGKDDADLIATVDGLAYSLFGQKKYDDAEPVYKRLIGLWTKSLGEDHPMVALAFDKVAIFYAEQKKYEQAKEALNHAVALRAHFFVEGLAISAAQQTLEKHSEQALALYKRALAAMDPPDPVYDEIRGQIAEIVKGMEAPLPANKPAPKAAPKTTTKKQ